MLEKFFSYFSVKVEPTILKTFYQLVTANIKLKLFPIGIEV